MQTDYTELYNKRKDYCHFIVSRLFDHDRAFYMLRSDIELKNFQVFDMIITFKEVH